MLPMNRIELSALSVFLRSTPAKGYITFSILHSFIQIMFASITIFKIVFLASWESTQDFEPISREFTQLFYSIVSFFLFRVYFINFIRFCGS